MKAIIAAMLSALALASAARAETAAPPGWLAGAWGSTVDGVWTEEHWLSPRGGAMLGLNRSGRGDRQSAFEFLRIDRDTNGVLTYWGSPAGKPPVPFRATASGPGSITFENPAHDYPTRIAYRLERGVLTATISGPGGANPMSWKWKRLR